MNERQRKVVGWGVILAVIAGLYVPWNYTTSVPNAQPTLKPAGYSFLFDPPAPEHKGWEFSGVRLDVGRLLIEWGVIALVATVMVLNLQSSDGAALKLTSFLVDSISEGVVTAFQKQRSQERTSAERSPLQSAAPSNPVETEMICQKCGAVVLLKEGKSGDYLACSNPNCPDSRTTRPGGKITQG